MNEQGKPLAHRTYLRELDPEVGDGRFMPRVFSSLRDEVLALSMQRYGGRSRELAMVASKCEEARLWAVAHGEVTGSTVVVDKREMVGGMADANASHNSNTS